MKSVHRSLNWVCFALFLILSIGGQGRLFAGEPGYFDNSHYAPPKGPVFEVNDGTNLFWHNNCAGGSGPCGSITAGMMGYSPVWYAKADALALWRDTNDDGVFAQGAGALLATAQFDSEYEAAGRILVGRTLGDLYRVEASFFTTSSWSDTVSIRDTNSNALGSAGNLSSPFSNFGNPAVLGLDLNTLATISFTADLTNAEFNLRRHVGLRCYSPHQLYCWPVTVASSCLIGLRYTQMNEDFHYSTRSNEPVAGGGSTTNVDVSAVNKMFGFQIGWLTQISAHPRLWVDLEAKGILFANDASQSTFFNNNTGGAVTSVAGAAQRDRTTFGGDFSVQANYQVTPLITVFGGYSAIVLEGVALADENFETDINVLTLGPASLNHTSSIVYHGLNFGLIFAH